MYYTPSIDEFHKGFEYEYLSYANNNWHKLIYEFDTNIDILKTRVKYLDESDIIDLGFRYNDVINTKTSYVKEVQSVYTNDYVELLFEIKYGEPFVEIVTGSGYVIFKELNIKNKSELSWLLNRYGLV